jgi:NADH-quinone oxidoreductase subunit N
VKDFVLILPEIFLAVTLVGILMGEVSYHGEKNRVVALTAYLGLGGAFVQTLISYQYGASPAFGHALMIDGMALFFKLLFISLAGLAIAVAMQSSEIADSKRSEYCALVLGSALAMSLAASAADLLLAFLALQFMNVIGHFLAAFGKRSVLSTEAAVKHMAFATVSGALFLYGIAILFLTTRTVNMVEMHKALSATPMGHTTALVVFVLTFLGLCFQIGAFPMYLWAPDVLEGAPTPASAFLSLGSKAAGFAVGLRFVITVFAQPAQSPGQWQIVGDFDWPKIVALVSGLTMVVGSLLALRQVGAKRLVAYLAVAESGYLLMGLLVMDQVGVAALLYSLVVEIFALLGAYFVLSYFVDLLGSDRLADLRGMLGKSVPESVCLIVFLVCLVGIPPLPGFIGKFALIGAAIRHDWHFLAVVAVVCIALGTIAVARLSYSLIGEFQTAQAASARPNTRRLALLAAFLLPMLLAGLFADALLRYTGQSLQFILW